MGMFDEIKCFYPLPEGPSSNTIFQTKNFYNVMNHYTITEGGRLILHEHHLEYVPEEERSYYGKPEWETNPIVRVFGSLKSVFDRDVDTNYHGVFNMYTMIDDVWYEYELKFTDGNLVEVKRLYKEFGNG